MTAARLLTEAEAREYLGGLDPRRILAPFPYPGRGVRWDRSALDAILDEQSGVRPNRRAKKSDADEWIAENS